MAGAAEEGRRGAALASSRATWSSSSAERLRVAALLAAARRARLGCRQLPSSAHKAKATPGGTAVEAIPDIS